MGASGVTQASAALYLPDGRRVGRDLGQGGRTPAVGACSGEAPLALFWHTAVRGAGLVRGLEFALDRAAGRALGLVEPDGAIGELALALRRRGFVPRGEERRLQVARGGEERFPLALAAHRCLTLVARGADAELALLEGEGVVARDGPGGEQAVQLCAPSGERTLVARVRSSEGGEVRVHLYDADERTLGGEAALWLGERAPALRSSPDVPGARLIELSPAEVREVALPPQEGCTRVRLIAGEGSRGVWLGQPAEPERAVDECVAGARARFGSIGGGQVWLQLPEGETTPRPPAQRGARR